MKNLSAVIERALREDVGTGDVTSGCLFEKGRLGRAEVLAKENFVVCGQEVAEAVCKQVDSALRYETLVCDGGSVQRGEVLATVAGPLVSIFSAERVLLNFLQRLSAIASLTRRYVERVKGTGVTVLDTRKTTPGLRELEKYAVQVGGGMNHRFGLYDAVLIKSNHLEALGEEIEKAVTTCREKAPGMKIEVEVRNTDELRKALRARPDALLLDNMSVSQVGEAVKIVRAENLGGTIELEVSGGIDEENISQYAASGVDSISVGKLTHSVKAVDISLRIKS